MDLRLNYWDLCRLRLVFVGSIVVTAGFLASCETKVDLIADYKNTPVIYGVLDAAADTQWFRINKTFLGEGNLLDYAAIRDSVEYDPEEVNAVIIKRSGNNVLATYPLQYTIIPEREPGIFFRENVTAFYTTEPLLNTGENPVNINYDLSVEARGTTATSTTNLVLINPSQLVNPNTLSANLQLATPTGNFRSVVISWNQMAGIYRYQVFVDFHLTYTTLSGQSADMTVVYQVANVKLPTVNVGSRVTTSFNSEALFQFIANQLATVPNVFKVRINGLDVRYVGANETLGTYMDVFDPSSAILTDRPEFTNINNGLGVFASKGTHMLSLRLDNPSVQKFRTSDITNQYCWCTDWTASSTYHCDFNPVSANSCP